MCKVGIFLPVFFVNNDAKLRIMLQFITHFVKELAFFDENCRFHRERSPFGGVFLQMCLPIERHCHFRHYGYVVEVITVVS